MQAMKAETLHAGSIRINTVRVDKALLVRVLDIMDGSQAEAPTELRRGSRLRYRILNAIVYPDNMDRTIAFVVPTRNLSAEGMAFLHSHMMYSGRSCLVQLPSRMGKWLPINATVVRCRHIRAMLHEVAVKFDQPIDLAGVYRMPGAS
jgi:hypothetical protein